MVEQRDGFLRAVPLEARIKIRMGSAELRGIHYLSVDSFLLENSFQESRRKQLVARRIGGVDFQILRQNCLTFFRERVPVDRFLRVYVKRAENERSSCKKLQ